MSVHNLVKGYNTVALFNDFLGKKDFTLNDAGGKIKVSADEALLQSSTVARMVEAEFANNKKQFIAGSYVEFAERKVLPQYRHLAEEAINRCHRREGFEANNANKIFESTYASQTAKL